MFSSSDRAYDFGTHSQDDIAGSYSAPARHRAVFQSPADGEADPRDYGYEEIQVAGNKFFTGILIACPISALLWGLILCTFKAIFF